MINTVEINKLISANNYKFKSDLQKRLQPYNIQKSDLDVVLETNIDLSRKELTSALIISHYTKKIGE